MTELTFTKIQMPSAHMGKAADYPILYTGKRFYKGSVLGEEEGLYLNFGGVQCGLPYTAQDSYDHAEEMREFDAAILENDCLRATFLPGVGGKLWSLYDKKKERDLPVPIYWWSNIAVPQEEGARILVPADKTYVNHKTDPVYIIDIPIVDGVDQSYPTNHAETIDHFYKIPEDSRKFEAHILHGLANVAEAQGDRTKASRYIHKAFLLNSENITIVKQAVRAAFLAEDYDLVKEIFFKAKAHWPEDGLLWCYYAMALARTGEPERAKKIFEAWGGENVVDRREAADAITDEYIYALREIAKKEGHPYGEEKEIEIPYDIDYRMYHTRRRK